ncbi:hypothetical protein [Rhodocyclus tenuis]|uniref:hypothetical protein n=1 Tax=Rhodocyclus tenuis TaxID=1066 RepID=UPI0019088D88|nr:hypothetical protein [Rhodocyclus tenuis]MBK1680847.1 hypothetical protein [Rhodocyclus tenuis]
MRTSLNIEARSAGKVRRSCRDVQDVRWRQELPASWSDLAIEPVRFDVFREYEMSAERTIGHDEHDEPCFCACRYILTQLVADEDDLFFEMPVYAETLAAWRLRDRRWLVLRNVVAYAEKARRSLSFSGSMPR